MADISGKKKKEYLKAKIDEVETNSEMRNIRGLYRGISDFKEGYQPRTNMGLPQYFARWRNHFSQLLNVHGINGVRQTEIRTAEPLMPESRAFEVEMAIENQKRHVSPGMDQMTTELIKAGGRAVCPEIHTFMNSIWNKEELPEEWKESIIARIYKKGDKRDCSSYKGVSLLSTMYKIYPIFF